MINKRTLYVCMFEDRLREVAHKSKHLILLKKMTQMFFSTNRHKVNKLLDRMQNNPKII